jgi:hypothetical protein
MMTGGFDPMWQTTRLIPLPVPERSRFAPPSSDSLTLSESHLGNGLKEGMQVKWHGSNKLRFNNRKTSNVPWGQGVALPVARRCRIRALADESCTSTQRTQFHFLPPLRQRHSDEETKFRDAPGDAARHQGREADRRL